MFVHKSPLKPQPQCAGVEEEESSGGYQVWTSREGGPHDGISTLTRRGRDQSASAQPCGDWPGQKGGGWRKDGLWNCTA